MLTLEEIRRKKEEYRYTARQLAKLSGVPLGTLQKVLGGATKSPRYETLQALSAVFEGTNGHRRISYLEETNEQKQGLLCVRETEAVREPVMLSPRIAVNWHSYDRQGTYTLEDYLALPEDQRVELIDGVIYDMGSPTASHQLISGEIYRQISNYIHDHKGSCVPLIAPTDVQLDCDNRTIVEPDVMIVCDRSRISRSRVFGAPDFVLEVLSPSTRNKDIFVKGAKYMNAGIREYWMVDPGKKTVMTYEFHSAEDTDIHLYTFDEKVPAAIYHGDLVIDFKEIAEYISFIPET
ncbi:MAG: Uma2 family endonuclease [Parasporobacterium sp.]|nr:Uma2 family endonuclease [Parasporobacterium sp.]